MGIPGMILAPVFLQCIKVEAFKAKLPSPRRNRPTPQRKIFSSAASHHQGFSCFSPVGRKPKWMSFSRMVVRVTPSQREALA